MSKNIPSRDSNLSAKAPEFVPKSRNFYTGGKCMPDKVTAKAMTATEGAMVKLRNNPEEFYQVVHELAKSLSSSITDSATLESILSHILKQSIFQENYQYTGARLCSFLSAHLTTNYGNFQNLLITKCQSIFDKRNDLINTKEGIQELTGFTLFFAELMLSLSIDGLVKLFSSRIIELLSLLVSVQTLETIRCVNKVLKLTGSTLESRTEDMDNLFGKLKEIIISSDSSKDIRRILVTLLELRGNKWESDNMAQMTQKDTNYGAPIDNSLSEPVFHDENGEPVFEDYAGETGEYDFENCTNYFMNPEAFGEEDYTNYNSATEPFAVEDYTNYNSASEPFAVEDYTNYIQNSEDVEALSAEQENSGELYNGNDIPYEGEMDPEMDDAYEQFLADMESSKQK